ncbi:MAG: alpha-E domain-containing protein [Candidatus Sumerlaeia bacterium]|nr:alpha-E domain-containing protein [Candidatus Sumerlaeia bacterium]
MLSRVAESVFWMSRYIHRAEHTARLVDINLQLLLDLPGALADQWEPLVTITAEQDYFASRYGDATQRNVLEFLVFDNQYPSSIANSLRAARENARTVRDFISAEIWEQVNEFYHFVVSERAPVHAKEDPHGFFARVRNHGHLFSGLVDGTLEHGQGYHFIKLAEYLERADQTSRVLDVKYFLLLPGAEYVGTTLDDVQWAAVLKSASALESYRKRHHRIRPRDIAEYLLLDPDFPRSAAKCVADARGALHAITGNPLDRPRTEPEMVLGRLAADLKFGTIDEVFEVGLHEYIDRLQARLNESGAAVSRAFFQFRA